MGKDHKPWLANRRSKIDWKFWKRYDRYLSEATAIPKPVIRELNKVTDKTLDLLSDPLDTFPWDRRGLIVGRVQVGKTSNYIGLICKAVDAGFKLVIVLAGLHNDLRSQTQVRIDEGFLGFDTSKNMSFDHSNAWVGVGALKGIRKNDYIVHALTTSLKDFSRSKASGLATRPGGKDPFILVIKKNKSIIENAIMQIVSICGEDNPESPGQKIIMNVPFLLIDDEADHASVNTAEIYNDKREIDPELNPSTINRLIRQLLHSFQQSAYVGYTATPQANILVHDSAYSDKAGEDIFPRSFIINLSVPENYIGSETVFGTNRIQYTENTGLPIIRRVIDSLEVFPLRHKTDLIVNSLPDSMVEAIRSFVIVIAARMARGQRNKDNSMLIHVSRLNKVQDRVAQLVTDEINLIRQLLEYGAKAGGVELRDRMKALWEKDFMKTTPKVQEVLTFDSFPLPSWKDIEKHLFDAASRIEIRQLNTTAKNVLDYKKYKGIGLCVIAIGGDKLSRGLTLEGLSVSYFVRFSGMYDTLLQMGRWFGYRPGYADLCRLYTDPELIEWYRHISDAMEGMREQFDLMYEEGLTPQDYGLRIESHSEGLIVTNPHKMRAGQPIRMGYDDSLIVNTSFDVSLKVVDKNIKILQKFLENLGSYSKKGGKFLWYGVHGEKIASFFDGMSTPDSAYRANSTLIAKYIRVQIERDALTEWTVVLGSGDGSGKFKAGFVIVQRNVRNNPDRFIGDTYRIKTSFSPNDEGLDLSEKELKLARDNALKLSKKKSGGTARNPEATIGGQIRRLRPKERGMLIVYPIESKQLEPSITLLGFAVSFPYDTEAEKINYVANQVLIRELFGEYPAGHMDFP